MLTDKEIQQKLLDHYEDCLNRLPKTYLWFINRKKIKPFLIRNFISCGVCVCINNIFEYEAPTKWIYDVPCKHLQRYWYKPPREATSRKEVVECLQYRIDILKQLLKEH